MVGKQHGMGTIKYPDGCIEEGFWLEKKCLLTVQSIEVKTNVLGFEVPVNNLMETQIVLRIENFPNVLFCL